VTGEQTRHFDEGAGTTTADAADRADGVGSAELFVGGTPVGPLWSEETPFG
jgi:hypothetical protein